MAADDFAHLLQAATAPAELRPALQALADNPHLLPRLSNADARRALEAVIAQLDLQIAAQINVILHHPEFQALESAWRGVQYLVSHAETGGTLKIKLLNVGKRELVRTLRKFRGTAWDQSPLFRRIYDEEFGQFGGEPYGVLIGDYEFDHRPEDVQLLGDIAQICAVAHAPFITAAAPGALQMESWRELANPRDLTRIFQTPEYTAWRALREAEDSRYVGLCLPRVIARPPYGARTAPTEGFEFEEDVEGPDASRYLWMNPAWAMAANIARAFTLYGWCVRIRGIEGGEVSDLPALRFPTADGDVDRKCATEIAISERREAELARNGFISLVHRRGAEEPVFIGAPSLQKPQEYADADATTNARLASRLPYLFACSRFAHYLKCMVRDKIGGSQSRTELQSWLSDWLRDYVDGYPEDSDEAWKASHPLIDAEVTLEESDAKPGQYAARFFLRPHFQLEGMTAALRLVSRLPAQ